MAEKTQNFDLIIIGTGSGLNVLPDDLKVAVIEKGAVGGTCLNRGCIPTKIILHSADIADTINDSKKFGINSSISSIDFENITSKASDFVDKESKEIEENLKNSKNIKFIRGEAKFIAEKTIKVNNEILKGDKIIIAAGARPTIPKIDGLDQVKYITSTEALRLKKQPKSMTIIGGGFIAVEFAHFYNGLGTKINIIQRSENLLSRDDEEISEKLTGILKKKYNVFTESTVKKVWQKGNLFYTQIETPKGEKTIESEQLLIAMGVTPNSDTLDLQKGKIKVNKNGFIEVNDYLETSSRNVWALGDIVGKFLLKHNANYEAGVVYNNAILGEKVKRNYTAMPHGVFSNPQIAGVGATEQELKENKTKYVVGRYNYIDTGMGRALQDNEGFVKILVDKKTKKILGCHILGSDAANLIQEIVVSMQNDIAVDEIRNTIHIHPALSEVIQRALNNIE